MKNRKFIHIFVAKNISFSVYTNKTHNLNFKTKRINLNLLAKIHFVLKTIYLHYMMRCVVQISILTFIWWNNGKKVLVAKNIWKNILYFFDRTTVPINRKNPLSHMEVREVFLVWSLGVFSWKVLV
jgi:hypothetical protein